MTSRAHRRRIRPLVAVSAVIIVSGAGVSAAVALGGPAGHSYRTAVVTRGAVAQQLRGTGTIQPVAQASVAFPIAGTVASVAVAAGSQVAAGQVLATLDATSLQSAVLTKQAALAAAQLTLYKALHGESTSSATGSGTARTATTTTVTPASTAPGGGSSSGGTAAAEQQLLTAQQAVDAAMAAVQTAEAAAATPCGTAVTTAPSKSRSGGTPTSVPSGSGRSTPGSTTPTTAAKTTLPATGLGTAACVAAQQGLVDAEQTLTATQDKVAQAVQNLERVLVTSVNGANSGSTNGNSAGSPSSAAVATSPSAAQLVADQAAVDAAATEVLAAQEAVQQATITSPIAGTVEAVALQVGHAVSASSTTASIVVAGAGGYEISTTVGVANIAKVNVGETATVVPDSDNVSLPGKVVWIGAASGSSSATTYPVVIGLHGDTAALRNGAMASTSIELAHTQASALIVPTSAVHTTNGVHVVTVLTGTTTSAVRVQIGVVGVRTTQITSGLTLGQVVVLADLHAAVPSSNTNSRATNALTSGFTNNSGSTGGGGNRFGP